MERRRLEALCEENQLNLALTNIMFDTIEGFSINSHYTWETKEFIQPNMNPLSPTLPHFYNEALDNVEEPPSPPSPPRACLEFAVPPENRFRYRYDTEMSGTHGSLQGLRKGREKSTPTVKLLNYPHEAFIRISVMTCQGNSEYYPHPHSLFVKEKFYLKRNYYPWDKKILTKTGHFSDPHYIKVGAGKNDYTARFVGMCIISSKKENFYTSVREKLQLRDFEEKNGVQRDVQLTPDESEELAKRVEAAVSAIDVDCVCLCFEAFREEDGKLFPICPPLYSEPIGNAKSAKTGKLKISRINKCSGSCKGGDEIWLLVEKICKKGLVVRFSEECNGEVIWQSCLEGDDLILHHQYAIIFKTPEYRDVNITSEVEVLMRLERTTQQGQTTDYSEPITFVYEPLKSKSNKGDNLSRKESILAPLKQNQMKRPRTELSDCSYQSKRKPDDLEFENMILEDTPDGDIEHLLLESKDSLEFDPAWSKFTVEDFMRYISSDDAESVAPQKDGVSPQNNKLRLDQLYKLYLLYSKLDENDIKKLTDQISNFRVSKKEIFETNTGSDKDQVNDAASTLLSLRSGSLMANHNPVPTPVITNGGNKEILNSSCESCDSFESSSQPIDVPLEVIIPDVQTYIPVAVRSKPFLKTKQSELPEEDSSHQKEKKAKNDCDYSSEESKAVAEADKPEEESENIPIPVNPRDFLENEGPKIIKTETDTEMGEGNEDKMGIICQTLNETGSWRYLAEIWDCSFVLPLAAKSENPSRVIFEYVESRGCLELEMLRDLLQSIDDKKALFVLEGILSEKYS